MIGVIRLGKEVILSRCFGDLKLRWACITWGILTFRGSLSLQLRSSSILKPCLALELSLYQLSLERDEDTVFG